MTIRRIGQIDPENVPQAFEKIGEINDEIDEETLHIFLSEDLLCLVESSQIELPIEPLDQLTAYLEKTKPSERPQQSPKKSGQHTQLLFLDEPILIQWTYDTETTTRWVKITNLKRGGYKSPTTHQCLSIPEREVDSLCSLFKLAKKKWESIGPQSKKEKRYSTKFPFSRYDKEIPNILTTQQINFDIKSLIKEISEKLGPVGISLLDLKLISSKLPQAQKPKSASGSGSRSGLGSRLGLGSESTLEPKGGNSLAPTHPLVVFNRNKEITQNLLKKATRTTLTRQERKALLKNLLPLQKTPAIYHHHKEVTDKLGETGSPSNSQNNLVPGILNFEIPEDKEFICQKTKELVRKTSLKVEENPELKALLDWGLKLKP